MNDLALRLGMAAVLAWILYTIFEIVLAAYKCWAFRRLLKQEKLFLDRWYASDESREFEARYRAFKPAKLNDDHVTIQQRYADHLGDN